MTHQAPGIVDQNGAFTTAWKSAGTGADVSGVGTVTWSTPGNITAFDDAYAVGVTAGSGNITTHWLRATNFGFDIDDIPSGATILGIEVGIERKSNTGDAVDNQLFLRKTSGQVGDDKASATAYPASDTEELYGGSADDWNASLLDSDIRSTDFGLDLSSTRGVGGTTSSVDHIRVRVFGTT